MQNIQFPEKVISDIRGGCSPSIQDHGSWEKGTLHFLKDTASHCFKSCSLEKEGSSGSRLLSYLLPRASPQWDQKFFLTLQKADSTSMVLTLATLHLIMGDKPVLPEISHVLLDTPLVSPRFTGHTL